MAPLLIYLLLLILLLDTFPGALALSLMLLWDTTVMTLLPLLLLLCFLR
jgi:hypothetical protein